MVDKENATILVFNLMIFKANLIILGSWTRSECLQLAILTDHNVSLVYQTRVLQSLINCCFNLCLPKALKSLVALSYFVGKKTQFPMLQLLRSATLGIFQYPPIQLT